MISAKGNSLLTWLLIAVQLVFLVFFAFNRLVDGDEGFYLSAAREVALGRTLYSDFFYPQMPYLPYIFSLFSGHGFATLFATRLASVLMGLLTTLIFYALLKKLTSDRKTVNFILILYLFSGLVISWHSVAKTFAWTDFFLLGAFYSLVLFLQSSRNRYLIVCGLAMALAVNTRLVLLPLVIVFYLPLIIDSGRQWLKRTAAYMIPMVLATIPSLVFLVGDTRRFVFDNFGFHLMRNPGVEFPASLLQKLLQVGKLLANPQTLILLIIALGAYIYWRKRRKESDHKNILKSIPAIAGITAIVISVTYLLPNPVLQQYFVQAVPFVLLASAGSLQAFIARARETVPGSLRHNLPAIITTVYLLGIIPYFVIYIGAVRDFDGHSDIGNMKRLCASLDETAPDEMILTEMPIVSVLADRPIIEGVEFLGFEYPLPLDSMEKRYYRLVLNKDLKTILDNRQASYYVVVNNPPDDLSASTAANYDLEETFERYRVYRRKS